MTVTTVGSLAALQSAVTAAATNDVILLSDGSYNNGAAFDLSAPSATKLTIAAEHNWRAIITGSPIHLASAGIHMMGFDLQYSLASGNYMVIKAAADDARLSHNKIHFGNGTGTQHWITVLGDRVKVDHNEMYTKSTDGNMVLIGSAGNIATDAKIFYNHFYDHTIAGETVRLGASNTAQVDFRAEVSYNRFKNCKADHETITVKTSNNNIHHNYLEDCYAISQRHGHNSKFNDNVFVRAGLRLSGYGHEAMRNQIIEDPNPQIWTGHLTLENGDAEDDPGTPGTVVAAHAQYARVKNCVIRNNIIAAGSATSAAVVYLGESARTFYPQDNDIFDNIITASTGTLGVESGTPGGLHYNVTEGADSFSNLNATSSLRYGIEAQTGSALIGDQISSFRVRLRKSLNPSGNVTANIRRASDDAVVAAFQEAMDAASLTTSFNSVTFTLASPYTVTAGDRILIEYSGPSTVQIELWTTDQYDLALTRRTRYQGGVYSAANTADIVAQLAGPETGAVWSNQNMTGNILWPTGTATTGSIPGVVSNPNLLQNADRTYSFTGTSPLSWTNTGRVIPAVEVGTIRSFM